jgi:squalene-associated FAD-dependent desaturase
VRVAIAGGGLAGLAAALDLADAGHEVVLFEARPTLGGAVQTLPEREGDPPPPPDNGQHIALGCCTEYLGFLRRVGRERSVLRTRLALPVIGEDGHAAVLGSSPLAVLRYGHVSVRERLRVARVVRRLARLDPGGLDGVTFADLLGSLGQSDAGIERFWDVFMRPALNLRSGEASAAPAVFTVQTALLGGRGASDLVLPTAPLGAMHGDAAGRALAAAGAEIRLRTRVTALAEGGLALAGGARVPADGVVLALPPDETARLLGEPDPGLGASPIVSVHLLFDRPLLRPVCAALLGSPAHWIFDRGRLTGSTPPAGQYLTVVASGVPDLAATRGRDLVELMTREVIGRLGGAELLWSRVSREPEATFAATPGTEARRPGTRTGLPNVVRAGAWTATGWPATMEGAIRSGRAAAATLLAARESL